MLALQITSLKQFMYRLLNTEIFDGFLLEEAIVTTAYTYHVDGHVNRDFFEKEEDTDAPVHPDDFAPWKTVRPLIFDLIKGKRTPLNFKLVLHLGSEEVSSLFDHSNTSVTPDQIRALVLTIKFDGEKATLLTGTSFHTFLPDKEPDIL